MLLHLSTWAEIEDFLGRSRTVVIPIGSNEQHGPTGLLGTDWMCPEIIAHEAQKAGDILVAPTFNIGMAQHHLDFPGTIALRPSTFMAAIGDWCRSLAHHGFEKLYFLNGHGGNVATIEAACARAEADPDGFWTEIGRRLDWSKPFTEVKDISFDEADFRIRWFADGELNVSVNCLDRHLPERGDQIAVIWESDDPEVYDAFTYRQLHAEVCRWANVLKAKGVRKGDRVTIYLPMIPAAAAAMLACARIGAVHSVVFGGFSPDSLAGRIQDCDSRIVITANEGLRGGKVVPLKANVDEALQSCPRVTDVIVVRRTPTEVPMVEGRDAWYADLKKTVPDQCDPEPMNAEDPLFILYTSGSTGKPKGVLHTTGGYQLFASMTHQYVFDYHDGDVYWCTADVGWVTGHSYVVYGPLANAATTVMFEGVPNHPTPSRFWEVVDKHKVEIFYTAPTAIRALMRENEEWVERTSRASLRLLGTVGEPINPEAWLWYHRVVGHQGFGGLDPHLQGHVAVDALALDVVRIAHHGGFGDLRMRHERRLDLRRAHAVA